MMHKTKNRAAFTLIELLAAMAVLSIMMLMFANIFSSSGKAWTSGTRRTEQNMNGRAVLEYMGKEIGQAIINTNGIAFQVEYDTAQAVSYRSYLYYNSALHFVSTRGCDSAGVDEARIVQYYVRQDTTQASDGFKAWRLMRAQCTDHTFISSLYKQATTPSWFTTISGSGWASDVLVDNISQFYVAVGTNGTANPIQSFKSYNFSPRTQYHLPNYVDIMIGFLSEDDARKARWLTNNALTNYLNKVEKRFTRRIYMENRTGYQPVP